MDGLNKLAEKTYEEQEFRPHRPGHPYDVIRVAAFPTEGTIFDRTSQAENNLVSFLEEKASVHGQQPDATLRLIRFRQDLNVTVKLGISRQCFSAILDSMGADRCVLYMICRDYDGFHCYGRNPFTGFMNSDVCSGVDIEATADVDDNDRAVPGQAKRCGVRRVRAETSEREGDRVRTIERRTGYGREVLSQHRRVARLDINQITEWSQTIGEVQGNIANKQRHHGISKSLLDFIEKEYDRFLLGDLEPYTHFPQYGASMKLLAESIPAVHRHMKAYADYMVYLRDRAEKLSNVLFALLTHEDAETNLDLAEAMRRDSSSMKTIAVMTMAFLPAIFFAALFAVPFLKWDQAEVVQSNFWIYWAFTLPATAAIFLLWGVISNWEWIMGRMRKKSPETGEKAV